MYNRKYKRDQHLRIDVKVWRQRARDVCYVIGSLTTIGGGTHYCRVEETSLYMCSTEENISSRFFRNSEAFASEFLENLGEMLLVVVN